ncbi:hypothetical protein SAMN04488035_0895 [Flavimobilis marinus]|uniref:YlxR domain-containing protein n=1 Tax=Flavimobilis marinus TaxID=285351 RepID=A0A1I2E5L9_9MICO|nr:YlxR family protein [Flavimobilis marinus]SFE88007.1 hypothetical protein SAMN04488035_0895 [Flavimobilis marinus]
MRTCVGCRGTGPRAQLVRLVAAAPHPPGASRVVVDQGRCLPGRGAWLHQEERCLGLAERRRAVIRALRLPGPADLAGVHEWFARGT